MKSMTGFGKGDSGFSGGVFSVEVSSVNRKQLEIRLSLGGEFSAWEISARSAVASRISRGAVSLRVNYLPSGGDAQVEIDDDLLRRLAGEAARLRSAVPELGGSLELSNLFLVPGVVCRRPPDPENSELKNAFQSALNTALDRFDAMRLREGESLMLDIKSRLDKLRTTASAIRPFAGRSAGEQKKRLLEKLAASGLPVAPDDERFLKEVVFYLDKADFTEEITRLESHFDQFDRFLADTAPVGRSMDFLVQEMFREINTLGNKANDAEVSKLVVSFKTELEKMREQIQNIE